MNAGSFPTFLRLWRFIRRCLRRLRLLFFSRRSAVVYLILGTLLYLACTIDRWHGRRAWAAEKERLAAAGESLDLRELLPKRPPDEENFFAIPELAKLGDPGDRLAGRDDPLRLWLARDWVERPNFRGKMGRAKLVKPAGMTEAPLLEWCVYFRQTGMLPKQPLSPDPAMELLLSAERWQALLNAMVAASERRAAVFLPAPAERLDANGQPVDYLAASEAQYQVLDLARSLTLHGRACVETGETGKALNNLRVLQRLAEGYGNEPGVIKFLFSELVNSLHAAIIRAGVQHHRWDAAQLEQFGAESETEGVVTRFSRALAVERARTCQSLAQFLGKDLDISPGPGFPLPTWTYVRLAPEGPFLRYCARLSGFYSNLISEFRSPDPQETWLHRINRLTKVGMPALSSPNFSEATVGLIARPLFTQRLLRTACALERHYLMHRRYPAALSEISASMAPEVMTDIDGQPFRYRTAPDGSTFRLWSVGRNGKDDTGTKDAWDDWSFSTEK